MSRQDTPELRGLVLAGGRGLRMGRDKGRLESEGEPLVQRCYALLRDCCGSAYVSVREDQAGEPPYTGLPLVVDAQEAAGPAAGLLAAWSVDADAAWCVLAVDMARVDAALLERLIAARDPAALATAFVHPDGTREPLCTIWEPSARAAIAARAAREGVSLRRILESADVRLVEPPDPARLLSLNTPEDLAAWRT